MKILYITSVLGSIGGSEIYCKSIIQEMAKRGHQILIATTQPREFKEKNIQILKIPVLGHHALHKFTAPLFYQRIINKAREFKPDVVQSHSNSLMGLIGDRVKKDLKIPHVLLIEMISSDNNNLHTKLIYQTEKFLLPKLNYDKVIIWTKNMEKKFLLPWGIKKDKIKVIPAALEISNYDLNVTGKRIKQKYGENLIVTLKTFWTTNILGLTYIVKAMKYVKKKHPEYKYLCAGAGNSNVLQKIAKKEKVDDVIIFPGNIPEKEKSEYWAATDIAPHSFVYEFSASISLLEFMAMGKANLITNVGAVEEYVKDSAVLVEPKNPKSIANGINYLIENPVKRKELGKKARKLFESEYSIKSTVDKLEKIYSELK